MSDARTPAQIEAAIVRRRQELAATLDELATRVHPQAIMSDVRARTLGAVDQAAGRAFVAANRAVTGVKSQLVAADGSPRLDRVVPVALAAVAVVGLLALGSRRPRKGSRRR
ncbi:DUF3618 domain-containing protein [Streptomyces sp. NPDC051940]|uniref:DUF3618 domain-containing protein n=1 Tax=Streptomyces sp. NPDC051940 TaxID=3155675 RepID=UPI00342A22E4